MTVAASPGQIIDCHTHIFPDWRRTKLIKWARRALPDHPVPPDADVETAVRMLDAAGTERWINLLFPIRAGEAAELHRFNAELAEQYTGCVPVGGVHVDDVDPVYVVREGVEDFGMVGIKLHPLVQGFAPTDGRLVGALDYLERVGGLVYIHTGFEAWYQQRRQFADVAEAVRRHPGITFVLPHVAYPRMHEAMTLAVQHPNVWLDLTNLPTTGSPAPPRGVDEMVGQDGWETIREQVRQIVEQVGGRVVHGTDHPAGLSDPRRLLEDFLAVGLSQAAVRDVLWNNPTRLLAHAAGVPARAHGLPQDLGRERMG